MLEKHPKASFRFFKSWESYGETQLVQSGYLYTFFFKNGRNGLSTRWGGSSLLEGARTHTSRHTHTSKHTHTSRHTPLCRCENSNALSTETKSHGGTGRRCWNQVQNLVAMGVGRASESSAMLWFRPLAQPCSKVTLSFPFNYTVCVLACASCCLCFVIYENRAPEAV